MFWKRLLSGAVLLLVTLGFGFLGGPYLAFALAVSSSLAFIEFTKASKVREEGHRFNIIEGIGLVTIICYYIMLLLYEILCNYADFSDLWLFKSVGFYTNYTILILLIFTVGVVCILCAYIFWYPKFHINQVAGGIFGMIYTAFMMSFIYYTRELTNGVWLVWLIFITSWVSDTCAYFVGSAIGKHKMTPRLSPKKSWEGAVGGVLGSIIVSGLYALLFSKILKLELAPVLVTFLIVGSVGAVFSMFGDLTASAIKRNNNVKDYGDIIPGHGGILDRFDSVLFTAPMVYFLIVLFLK